jgi:hypothetical protein
MGSSEDKDAQIERSTRQWRKLVRVCSLLFIPMILVTTYIGLVEFFFVGALIILTVLVTLFTYSVATWPDLPIQILWFIYLLRSMELMLSLFMDIFNSFFRQIWATVTPRTIRRALNEHIEGYYRATSLFARGWILIKLGWLLCASRI